MRIMRVLPLLFLAMLALGMFQVSCDELITESNTVTLVDSTLGIGCFDCHTDEDNLLSRPKGQFANSRHADYSLLDATVTINGTEFDVNGCGKNCHTHEGFIKAFDSVTVQTSTFSPISCFTCHMPHTGEYGEWSADTLRAYREFVTLTDGTTFGSGKSTMCAHCHQATSAGSQIGQSDLTLDGTFGPHYSAQADVVSGNGGFRFSTINYNHPHDTTTNNCNKCHYGTGQGYLFGEHTFRLSEEFSGLQWVENCNVSGCHSGASVIEDLFASEILDTIGIFTDSLETLLKSDSILDPFDNNGLRFVAGRDVTPTEAMILYNYLLVRMDGSRGIHNPTFVNQLMKETVAKYDSLAPTPGFSADPLSGCAPLSVQFTDESSGNQSIWIWEYNGTFFSSEQNPQFTFDTPGSYSITLTVAGIGDSASLTKDNYIVVDDVPAAAFSSDTTLGCLEDSPGGVTISFVNETQALTATYEWDFGDGESSTGTNPQHVYTSAGLYTVTLIATSDCGVDTLTEDDYITISDTQPVADFDFTPDGGNPLQITFNDLSAGAATWEWDVFVDDEIESTEQSYVHTFSGPGTFDVRLVVTNACGADTLIQQVAVSGK